jgi:hypothetical protein
VTKIGSKHPPSHPDESTGPTKPTGVLRVTQMNQPAQPNQLAFPFRVRERAPVNPTCPSKPTKPTTPSNDSAFFPEPVRRAMSRESDSGGGSRAAATATAEGREQVEHSSPTCPHPSRFTPLESPLSHPQWGDRNGSRRGRLKRLAICEQRRLVVSSSGVSSGYCGCSRVPAELHHFSS